MKITETFRSLINPSGGLAYHYSAFRHRRFHWAPYTSQLKEWLESWPHNKGSLLLLGPSAGYSLSTHFLQGFDQVDAVDPDPLAQNIFRKNHPINHLEWHKRDDFGTKSREWNPHGIETLLNDFPDHKILFCNFLGQLPALFPELTTVKIWEQWQTIFKSSIEGRKWASYHDLYSANLKSQMVDTGILKRWERDQERDPSFYIEQIIAPLKRNSQWTIIDHCTNGLFPTGRRRLFLWQRLPRTVHFIEARRTL